MALTEDDVGSAIMIHVVDEDPEACIRERPLVKPLPFVRLGVDLLKPAVRCEDVDLAVAVADAVAVFRFAELVDDNLPSPKLT